VFWDAIEDHFRTKAHSDAIKAMASIGADVSDQRYFESVISSYRKASPDIENALEKHSIYLQKQVDIKATRAPNGLYSIQLIGDGLGTCGFAIPSAYLKDYDPSSADFGISADRESSLLMALVLELVSSRVAQVGQVVYAAHDTVDKAPVVFEASIKPSDYATHKSAYANVGDFVKANKSVLRDTFSGWKCQYYENL
jgi:hypothetical protein